MEIDLPS